MFSDRKDVVWGRQTWGKRPSINQSIYLSTLLVHNIRGSVRITDIQMQVGLSDLKMLTGHQGRNKPSLTDAPYIHTLGREYLSAQAYSNSDYVTNYKWVPNNCEPVFRTSLYKRALKEDMLGPNTTLSGSLFQGLTTRWWNKFAWRTLAETRFLKLPIIAPSFSQLCR